MSSSDWSHGMSKPGIVETTAAAGSRDRETGMDELDEQHKSTFDDARNMRRMGRSQELIRHFRSWSMVSFVAIATSAWELSLFGITPGLTDGGRPVLVYAFLWNFVGFVPVYLSMAEMASIAPIAGAQYHWVSEFAPDRYQKILSYLTGWTSTLAWQAGNAQGLFIVGSIIQSIITINDHTYSPANWHGTLLVMAITAIALCGNVYGARLLPYWQNVVFVVHILAYFGFLAPVWVNAPRVESSKVWSGFENSGGWPSLSLAVLIGQMPGITGHVGVDTAAHMSEEVRDASRNIPRVMLIAFAINFTLTLVTLVTLAYHIPSVTDALQDETTYPAIYVLRRSMSLPWLNFMLIVIAVLLMFGNLSYLAAVSRDLFAFARDRGIPFSGWISQVDKKRSVPTNACILSAGVSACLSLIYIGSPVAFYAITSLCIVSLLQCYSLSIGCMLYRRICHPETLPYARFSLGKYGVPINAVAVLSTTWGFFWCFWPQVYPVTAEGFNWASPIFLSALIIAMVYYAFQGRHDYHGPVVLVEGRKTHDS
ncbi:amino acid permease 2 [Metarhizium rileyi]|uniref:Amino acid permease 2 n=1 Tax=Metarhizium rileyi (strain RCEF 4871) TaxID=1649241 RepID=A0A167GV97_METRR|nr:amino acid permease 2 [Metarhizium rileyi RCEF 4871]TWU71511.1 hypothetical protein ED733_002411 [Metarhizium rileyi]